MRLTRRLPNRYRPSAICCASATWNLRFCEEMQARLPLELRNMVYKHIWDFNTTFETYNGLVFLAQRRCQGFCEGKEEECQRLASTSEPGTKSSCRSHRNTPFFMRPGYVGQETAREVVEAWYLHGGPRRGIVSLLPRSST